MLETITMPAPPHDRYKLEVFDIGEDGDLIVFGTHDAELAARFAWRHNDDNVCDSTWPTSGPYAFLRRNSQVHYSAHFEHRVEECHVYPEDGRPGWWRQRPGGESDDWAWYLVPASGPGRGVRPAIYFSR